jgi:hypothetical protein
MQSLANFIWKKIFLMVASAWAMLDGVAASHNYRLVASLVPRSA